MCFNRIFLSRKLTNLREFVVGIVIWYNSRSRVLSFSIDYSVGERGGTEVMEKFERKLLKLLGYRGDVETNIGR